MKLFQKCPQYLLLHPDEVNRLIEMLDGIIKAVRMACTNIWMLGTFLQNVKDRSQRTERDPSRWEAPDSPPRNVPMQAAVHGGRGRPIRNRRPGC